jgi:hypothetical protein
MLTFDVEETFEKGKAPPPLSRHRGRLRANTGEGTNINMIYF